MNIQNWGIGQIMELPDWCFGRRWPISVGGQGSDGVPEYDICEEGLPDMCVIWEVYTVTSSVSIDFGRIELRLGDHLPANRAEFAAFELLFPGIVDRHHVRSRLMVALGGLSCMCKLRMPVAAQGRRLVGEFSSEAVGVVKSVAGLTISSIPKEVPGWLVSGNLRSP